MTSIVIDLTDERRGDWCAEDASLGEGASIQDDCEIVLTLGPCEIRMSYSQFDRLMENVTRWRWKLHSEDECRVADLNADHPPPSWEAHRHAVEEELATERHSIACVMEQAARNRPELPGPEKGDKLGLRWFLAGRSHGCRSGLEDAAKLVRERAQKQNMVVSDKP